MRLAQKMTHWIRHFEQIEMERKAANIGKGLDGFLSGLLSSSMEGKPVICGTCASVRASAWEPCRRCGEVD